MDTKNTTAEAISQWVDSRGIRRQFIADQLGIRKDLLSRMLSDQGRWPSERLSPQVISRIAALLEVPRATEAEWLGLLDRQPASVA